MKNITPIFSFLVLILSSCVSNKSISPINLQKGTRLVKAKELNIEGERAYEFNIFEVIEKVKADVSLENDKISIIVFDKDQLDLMETDTTLVDLDFNLNPNYELPYRMLFKGELEANIKSDSLLYNLQNYLGSEYAIGERVTYRSTNQVFQAITIPFKFRSEIEDLPYEVTTGINAGFGYGIKISSYDIQPLYRAENKSMEAYFQNRRSFSILPFLGFTTIDQNPKNTNPKIAEGRKIFGLNYGVAGIIEFNKLSLGLAYGVDSGLGEGKNDWIYQNKGWWGVIVGLELIK